MHIKTFPLGIELMGTLCNRENQIGVYGDSQINVDDEIQKPFNKIFLKPRYIFSGI